MVASRLDIHIERIRADMLLNEVLARRPIDSAILHIFRTNGFDFDLLRYSSFVQGSNDEYRPLFGIEP